MTASPFLVAMSNGAASIGQTWDSWEADVLNAIGAPVTQANIDFLDLWNRFEQSDATYNPLNTTQGSGSIYNSAGVKNFTSPSDGAQATAATLQNGYYPNLVAALRSGNPMQYVQSIAGDLNTWGSHSFVNNLLSGTTPAPSASPSPAPSNSGSSLTALRNQTLAGLGALGPIGNIIGAAANAQSGGPSLGLQIGAVVVGCVLLLVGVVWLAGGEITSQGVASAALKGTGATPALKAAEIL